MNEMDRKWTDRLRSRMLDYEEAEPEGFPIIEYYGTYGDCVAVMLGFLYGGFFPVAGKVFVADIAFYFLDTNRIKIWKEF